jgi:alanyl-tRNA synthetase
LKPQFPELSEDLDQIDKILDVEYQKYKATRQKTTSLLKRLIEKKLSSSNLIELYDSQGIAPEMIRDEAEKLGKKVTIPKNFYALVAERHEKERPAETKVEREVELPLAGVVPTKALYFDDYTFTSFDAKVVAIIDNYVVLDQTAFYPVSGGQLGDKGALNGLEVVDVFKQGPHIVHVCAKKPKFHVGEIVKGEIELGRRIQLSQHHTTTHIINAAARRVLGKHINQASARKDIDKAYLDITHYLPLTEEQIMKIEQEANKIVNQGIKLKLCFMPRAKAEEEFGMTIYQGGAVPGKELRIVIIPGVDVEACGGTHVKNTLDVGSVKIIKTTKVQDGIVRIYFVSGKAAEEIKEKDSALLEKVAEKLDVEVDEIPARAEELFEVWKKARKAVKKKRPLAKEELELKKKEKFKGDALKKASEILRTQPEFVLKTIERFLKELKDFKKELGKTK